MSLKKHSYWSCLGLMAAMVSLPPAWAMTAAELSRLLEQNAAITVIDIRGAEHYQKGHIPGAINIPAAVVPAKQLPALNRVVVCGDGLGRDSAAEAVDALNRKPGIRAETLDGGFAAWQSLNAATTHGRGVSVEDPGLITYQQLKAAQGEDVILVDLRRSLPQARQSGDGAAASRTLTDLRKEFPKAGGITRSPFNLPQARQSGAGEPTTPPLLVLVDDGDGSAARAMASQLKANGNKRVVILAGGEEILARGGKPGLQRLGGTLGLQFPLENPPQ